MLTALARTSAILTVLLSFASTEVSAQVCDEQDIQETLQYLRRASLDLRGRLPSVDELNSIVTNQEIDPAIIDGLVESDEALEQVRKYHRDLLWTNVTNQRLSNNQWSLVTSRRGNVRDILFMIGNNRSRTYRGAQVQCANRPQSELGYDAITGFPNTETNPQNGAELEGWVEVEPYWAPGTTVKVCAFEAQTNETATNDAGRTVNCKSAIAKGCGCGPNLTWCHYNQITRPEITESFNEQLLRFVDDVVKNDRPYTDILTAKDMQINGPISHYFRYLTSGGPNFLTASEEQNYEMPVIDYSEKETWQTVDRGTRHAGVLTMPGYFLKFQSNRGRANRFYNAFLCQHFEAPEGGLPAADDDCHNEPNLTKRCGCKYCHQALEPASAHWGRWAEAGLMPMNEDIFPEINDLCTTAQGRRNFSCRRYYLTEAQHPDEEPYVGTLLSYVFADEGMKNNISEGPISIAREAIDSGTFATCTTNKMWSLFMTREPTANESETIAALAEDFKTDYSLRRLIKKIITRPEYISAGRHSADKE